LNDDGGIPDGQDLVKVKNLIKSVEDLKKACPV
jgi:hypothetical protein